MHGINPPKEYRNCTYVKTVYTLLLQYPCKSPSHKQQRYVWEPGSIPHVTRFSMLHCSTVSWWGIYEVGPCVWWRQRVEITQPWPRRYRFLIFVQNPQSSLRYVLRSCCEYGWGSLLKQTFCGKNQKEDVPFSNAHHLLEIRENPHWFRFTAIVKRPPFKNQLPSSKMSPVET